VLGRLLDHEWYKGARCVCVYLSMAGAAARALLISSATCPASSRRALRCAARRSTRCSPGGRMLADPPPRAPLRAAGKELDTRRLVLETLRSGRRCLVPKVPLNTLRGTPY
jgi:hypothetical protein